MRWRSTQASARAGEPSALAIAETLIAISVSVWIGVHFETWKHVLWGALAAPLTLLRTDQACGAAWRYFFASFKALNSFEPRASAVIAASLVAIPAIALTQGEFFYTNVGMAFRATIVLACTTLAYYSGLYLPILVITLFTRTLAIVQAAAKSPANSASAIPSNWTRTAFCEDITNLPELLPFPIDVDREPAPPGMRWGSTNDSTMWATRWTIDIRRELGSKSSTTRFVIFLVATVLVFVVPAYALRFAVKSTALIWLPIIWALKPARHEGEPSDQFLKLFLRSDLVRIVVGLSFAILFLLILKIGLFIAGHKLATDPEAWKPFFDDRLAAFITAFARPGEIPLWQIGSTVNAALALAAFFMARDWLRRIEVGQSVPQAKIDRSMGRMLQVRRLLTCYAIACNIYAVHQLTKNVPVPSIGWKLFPWL